MGVAFGLAGCGDEAPSGAGYASKDNTVKAGDAALSRDNLISTTYDAAVKAGSAHLAVTMGGQTSMLLTGDATFGGDAAMQLTVTMPQLGKGNIGVRYADNLLYVSIPGVTPAAKFVKIGPNDQSSPLAKGFAGIAEQANPLRSIKTLESALTSVDRVVVGELDGVSVDHYRVTVDADKLLKNLRQDGYAEIPKSLTETHKSVTYDMWLDDEFLLRKMTLDVPGTKVESLLSKWGQDVKVQRPATRDIMKAPAA